MKCSKRVLAVLAAGALSAATAVPALAMENEIHGMFRTYFDDTNFEINKDVSSLGGSTLGGGVTRAEENANFFETRLRVNYTAKLNDDVKIVSRFETNYYYWGNSNYTAARAGGGALGSRGVNIETKQIYLDLNTPSYKLESKIGMQPFTDDYEGIFVDSDMPGVQFSHNYEKGGVSAAFFRWDDADALGGASEHPTYGHNTRDLYVLRGNYEVAKDFKLGGAYYFLNANLPNGNPGDIATAVGNFPLQSPMDYQLHMLGINAEGIVGPVALNGFVVTQLGKDHLTGRDIQAFAGSAGAKMAVGPGTARVNFLYTSGDDGKGTDHAFRVGSLESGYYDNHMTVLGRNQYAMVNDNAIVFDGNNANQGSIFGSAGYDFPVAKDLDGSVNLGFAATDTNGFDPTTGLPTKPVNIKTGSPNGSNFLGTEVNAEFNYKLNTFTTLTAVGGYVFLGDYWKNTALSSTGGVDPNGVYDTKLVVTVAF